MKNNISIIGTIMMTVSMVWAGCFLLYDHNTAASFNEQSVTKALRTIHYAQQRYKETDWDNDGIKCYASFFVHLYQSVDINGKPIDVKLLPKEIAFAMGPSRIYSGYYFVDLHNRSTTGNTEMETMNPENAWAVAAIPVRSDSVGLKIYLISQTGNIVFKTMLTSPGYFPFEPLEEGWELHHSY